MDALQAGTGEKAMAWTGGHCGHSARYMHSAACGASGSRCPRSRQPPRCLNTLRRTWWLYRTTSPVGNAILRVPLAGGRAGVAGGPHGPQRCRSPLQLLRCVCVPAGKIDSAISGAVYQLEEFLDEQASGCICFVLVLNDGGEEHRTAVLVLWLLARLTSRPPSLFPPHFRC